MVKVEEGRNEKRKDGKKEERRKRQEKKKENVFQCHSTQAKFWALLC